MVSKQELSYSLHGGNLHITYNGQALNNVTGIWARGNRVPGSLKPPVPPYYQGYSRSAVTRNGDALYSCFKSALWVSDWYAIRQADYKPLQLQTAARIGFNIPETLFTSSPKRAKEFIKKYRETIIKPVANDYPIDLEKGTGMLFFAHKLDSRDKVDLSGLHLAPAIFQQAIDTKADLRVTVVGDQVFPAIIIDENPQYDKHIRDWRIGTYKGKLKISAYELPKNITEQCVALVRKLNLRFGAIDLVIDKNDKIWFLEINPNGQWAFVEEETGQPMGKALAGLLSGRFS